jgi:preprotein translocase subunit Sec61beta
MAVVYRAERDDGQFRKRVALKLVRAGVIPEDELLRRFREERQILAELEHPGIARLLDGGVTEDGTPWFALEYVAGTPIDRYCDERRLNVEQRLALFCAVCDAVQHAHRRRIVHRDLKPGNILVAEPDGEQGSAGQVKLLDFGIAKLLAAQSGAEAGERTRPGLRLMTPEYASPEQLRGDPVTPAADVYALGVLLCRLLGLTAACRRPGRGRAPGHERAARAALRRRRRARGGGAPPPAGGAGGRRGGGPRSPRRTHLRRYATFVLALALAAWFARDEGTAPAIDPEVIVVAPFHVAVDGSFDYLSEGLVDLLATSLNGETGSRAVDPRAVIAAWRSAIGSEPNGLAPASAQRIARGLGAGQLLMGSVVGTSERLTLNATLYDTGSGPCSVASACRAPRTRCRHSWTASWGAPGSGSGRARYQLAAATTTSLPALRSYLAGRQTTAWVTSARRSGRTEEALSHDSTFALAAIHLGWPSASGTLTAAPATRERALRLAWAARDRLGTPDRLFLEAIAGPRYPEPTPRHELLQARTRAVNAAPDRPEVLALMGEFHLGGSYAANRTRCNAAPNTSVARSPWTRATPGPPTTSSARRRLPETRQPSAGSCGDSWRRTR